jgi:hypothetical protein
MFFIVSYDMTALKRIHLDYGTCSCEGSQPSKKSVFTHGATLTVPLHVFYRVDTELFCLQQPDTMAGFDGEGNDGNSSEAVKSPSLKSSRITATQPGNQDLIVDKISIIQVMNVLQATTYKSFHYLDQTSVSAEDRKALCQWGFDIMNACDLSHDITIIAIGYFDRFFSNRGLRVVEACLDNRREFQLAFIVSLR